MRAAGFLVLMGFVLFVSLRIFTPPTRVLQQVCSPDGAREARLMHVFYGSEPGVRISVRTGCFWHTLLYVSEYADLVEPVRTEALRWSSDSAELFFEINGRPVWGWDFKTQSPLPSP